jgi:hypothetical protein
VQHGARVVGLELVDQRLGAGPDQVGTRHLRLVELLEDGPLGGVVGVAGPGVAPGDGDPGHAAPAEPPGQVGRERVGQALQQQQRLGEGLLALQHLDRGVQRDLGPVGRAPRREQVDAAVVHAVQAPQLALDVLVPARVAEAAPEVGRVDRRLDVEDAPDPLRAGQSPAEQLVAAAVQAPVVERPGLEHVEPGLPVLRHACSSVSKPSVRCRPRRCRILENPRDADWLRKSRRAGPGLLYARPMPAPSAPPLPRYGNSALSDLMPSLLTALDVPGFANWLGFEPVSRVCLLMVDGLGWELLRAGRRHAPFLNELAERSEPLTAGFPATTAASLGSLGTGLPPSGHGLVGYTMALPGESRAFNCLRWSTYGLGGKGDLRDRLVPEEVQPAPTAFERAAEAGVSVAMTGPAVHNRSGLSRAVFRGATYAEAFTAGDLAATAVRLLGESRRSLVYAYYGDLDLTGHVRGPGSPAFGLQLAQVDRLAAGLAALLPGDAVLVITGDHGMVGLNPGQLLDLGDEPELAAGVRVLAGEARARHVYAEKGAADDVLAAWRAVLGDSMWVVPGEQAIAEGWFGPDMPGEYRRRVGDVVAAAFGPVGVVQRSVDPAQARMRGHHGSLTSAEQLVPCLVAANR